MRSMIWPVIILAILGAAAPVTADVLRVDLNATGTPEDGSTWGQAYRSVQAALAAAAAAAEVYDEIWVAEGVYMPAAPGEDRGLSFDLPSGVAVYGGFAAGAATRDDRDPEQHETVLSGDLNGNDETEWDLSENSYHVVRVGGFDEGADPALLDGFTVTGGNADSMEMPDDVGGGIMVDGGALTLRNCLLTLNMSAASGGAVSCVRGTADIADCRMEDNYTGSGGGLFAGPESAVTLTRNVLMRNEGAFGGGVYVVEGGVLTAANCVFGDNIAYGNGGGVCGFLDTSVTLQNCTISGNHSDDVGGGLTNWSGEMTVSNSILWGNEPDDILNDADLTIASSIVGGGYPGKHNLDVDPRFRLVGAPYPYQLSWDSPAIDAATAVAPSDDVRGRVRPQNDGPDIGAYEFGTDSDGGGLPDDYEQQFGLSTSDPADDALDSDGDGLDNREEFRRGTRPNDLEDPPDEYYVSPEGDDFEGEGSESNPWQTIGYALENIPEGAPTFPITIHLAAGTYQEPVQLAPYVSLAGVGPAETTIQYYDPSADEHTVIEAAASTGLRDCTVTVPGATANVTILLRITGVAMQVSNVTFDGFDNVFSIAVQISEPGASETVIRDCVVRKVQYGVRSQNAAPIITRNTFEDILEDAIFVREPGTKDGEGATPRAGDVTDERTGYNTFDNVGNKFVQNMSATATMAELNFFGDGYTTEAAIAGKMTGGVDFVPFLGKSLFPGSICCYVYNSESADHDAIGNATVTLSPGGASITVNENGVYVFPALPGGDYSVTVAAPGYGSATRAVTLLDSGLANMSIGLTPGGPVDEPDVFCGFLFGKRQGASRTSMTGDAMVLGGLVGLLAFVGRANRRQRRETDH